MYFKPRLYKCETCDYEEMYSESDEAAQPTSRDGRPFCKACFLDFLTKNVPVMQEVKEQHNMDCKT